MGRCGAFAADDSKVWQAFRATHSAENGKRPRRGTCSLTTLAVR